MSKLLTSLCFISPIFLGLLLLPATSFSEHAHLLRIFERGLVFVLPLLFLYASLVSIARMQEIYVEDSAGSLQSRAKWVAILNLCLSVLSLLVSVGYLAERVSAGVIYLFLLAILSALLRDQFLRRELQLAALLVRFVFLSLLGFLSALIFMGSWAWQSLLISMALAAPLSTVQLASYLQSGNQVDRLQLRLLSLLICLGPVIITSLSLSGYLGRSYILILLVVLCAKPLLLRISSFYQEKAKPRNGLVRETTGISWLFVVILLLARVLSK